MSDIKSNITPKIRSLADRIKAVQGNGAVDKNNTLVDNDLFRKIATEDNIDVDRLITEQNYVSDFIAGNTLASGELSRDHMKANKDVGTVSGTFAIGRNKLEISFERHQRVPNRVMDKETGGFKVDGEKDLYGDATIKYQVRGAKNSKGDLKAVREFLSDDFRGAFSS